ncbi:MAG: glycosyltransferase [Myxococcales bacterium]|nr:glycosyltransferase [Myxococcales bacterium]MDD9967772.1 glycosyltransferase [Myxococcales bacterium]
MPSFQHLLITRFNLPYGRDERNLDDAWLAHRFDLFERFCAPSLQAQTQQNFRALLLLDDRTPERYRRRLERLQAACRLLPCYLSSGDRGVVQRAIEQVVSGDVSHVISTTLDNDDALARDFVARVQAEFRGQDFEFLNYPSGYRLRLPGCRLHSCQLESNPFLTLFEARQGARTIYAYLPHSTLARRHPIRDAGCEPMWLQVVHDKNLAATTVAGRPRVPLARLADRFSVYLPSNEPEGRLELAVDNVRRGVERAVLDRIGADGRARVRHLLRRVRSRS